MNRLTNMQNRNRLIDGEQADGSGLGVEEWSKEKRVLLDMHNSVGIVGRMRC